MKAKDNDDKEAKEGEGEPDDGTKKDNNDTIYDDKEAKEGEDEPDDGTKHDNLWRAAIYFIWNKIIFSISAAIVIYLDYYYLIVCVDSKNWMANLIIGIFELIVFIVLFPSVKIVFRDILSAFAKR